MRSAGVSMDPMVRGCLRPFTRRHFEPYSNSSELEAPEEGRRRRFQQSNSNSSLSYTPSTNISGWLDNPMCTESPSPVSTWLKASEQESG
ncbi:hypothetical protein V6N13_069233 [Hibiscus sabdariffa]|uniref:Uncharacterized protein n=1 Tax=Hibiscus sabdariffa TaxID=183260 RepID=A0ABR2PG03_9ROSI